MIGYVALGSNVGDPYANLVKARNYLNEDPQIQVVAMSFVVYYVAQFCMDKN